jgi:biotin-(acetyl-CoA carboxylase) ligase
VWKYVQFEKNGETRDAVAEDIDADGSLIVRYATVHRIRFARGSSYPFTESII